MGNLQNLLLVSERKFVAHGIDEPRAAAIVGHFCRPDPLYAEGRVNSIYFDTANFLSFKEKIEGDNYKRKYRLRWYRTHQDDLHGSCTAFLEIKFRYGSTRDKVRKKYELSRSWLESVSLEDGALPRTLYDLAASFPENIPLGLLPVACISYSRRRYRCLSTGITLCIDTDIRVDRINSFLFPSTFPFGMNMTVVEYKDVSLPEPVWFKHLYRAGFRLRSFSKYGESINQIQYGCAPSVIRMSI